MILDKLFAVGGCDGSMSLDSVEVLDPILDEWRLGPSMNIPRSNVGVAVLKNRLYAVGGFSGRICEFTYILSNNFLAKSFRQFSPSNTCV